MNPSELEGSYPLTPMQGGLLFHSLYGAEADVYFGQAHWDIRGPLDVTRFAAAWQRVVERHAILRTSFVRGGRAGPLQQVHRALDLPVETLDWRGLSPLERSAHLTAWLSADRARGFDLARPPLLRITLLRLEDDLHHAVWSGHHLLIDGRSIDLILREVMAFYAAAREGTPVDLPPPTPYADFVAWLERQDLAAAEDFWRRYLAGFNAPISFRTVHGAETIHPISTESLEIPLPAATRAAVARLARAAGVTLNTAIMAAWAVLCGRYGGTDDVVFGVTIGSGGRGAPLSRTLAGLLINTLPLRARLEPHSSVAGLLRAVRADLRALRHYTYTPLVDVARWSDVPAGRSPFDSLLVFDNSALDRLATRYGDLELGPLALEQRSNYPLNLVVRPGRELVLQLQYAAEYIDGPAVRRLGRHLHQILDSMAAHPEGRLDAISMLDAAERRHILEDWNPAPVERPATTLSALFTAQAQRTPAAVAVSCGRTSLTYADLEHRTAALARRLRRRGAGRERIVGLCLERSIDLVTAAVAIARTGAACLFLDPQAPAERLAFMLHDAEAVLCLSHRALSGRLPPDLAVLYLDDPLPAEAGDSEPEAELAAGDLAYVVYTSGTTGSPKGVAIEHRNAVNLVAWHTRAFAPSGADRVAQIAHPGFDALVWELWPNLATGACLCLPPDEVRGSPARLRQWLLEERITIAFVPTPLAEALLALPWPPEAPLRTMLVGGDVLHIRPDPALPFEVVNNYGPSECTVVATSGTVTPRGRAAAAPPSIGRPIGGVRVYLLDHYLQPVPVGVRGELYIGGAGVGRGYVNRPELTARAFIPDPFSPEPGARLYRTGDLARYRENGRIEFVGRSDDQIQLRGFRIEPGEIEATLRSHPAIRDAVVTVSGDAPGTERLVAHLVAVNGAVPPAAAVREYLQARLPPYMVPSTVVRVDAFPLSANGKVDRKRLAATPLASHSEEPAPAPPDSVEALLTSIWKAVLKLQTVGPHDSFFELGGNSLRAIELLEQIRLALGIELPLSELFRTPTVAGLAQVCHTASSPGRRDVLVPIQPLGTRPAFFCAAPVLGTVFPYYELAHAMRDDQPFYGLQPLGLTDRAQRIRSIEGLAAAYIDAMRTVQPHGPYHLGGWSFGGLVAFEMARQLRQAGESVAVLVVLDTHAPGLQHYLRPTEVLRLFTRTVLGGAWEYVRDYEYLAAGSRQRSPARRVLGIGHRGLGRMRGLSRSFRNRAAIAHVVPAESRLLLYHLPTIREMLVLFRWGVSSTLQYRPGIYPDEISLLRTSGFDAELPHSTFLGWDTVSSGPVTLHPIPGTHLTLLRPPNTRAVAQVLQELLDAAGDRPRQGIPAEVSRAPTAQ